MFTLLKMEKKFYQSMSQAYPGRFYSTTNAEHRIQSLIDSSVGVDSLATSKLHPNTLRNFQGVPIKTHWTSRSFSILPLESCLRHYSTQKQIRNTPPVSHHFMELAIPQKRTNTGHSYEKCEVSPIEKKIGFRLILLFLAILGTMTEVYAESTQNESVNEHPERIKAILNTKPEDRSSEDVMELFNYLHDKGEIEAKKAIGKNVVIVFGDTGAGKSTLINFLWGCTMRKNPSDPRLIEVDPESVIKEVAPIGQEAVSCTLIPTMVGDLGRGVVEQLTHEKLTFYDMPGLSDNRGFEVDLASAITMSKIVENAKSVKFVMLFEYPIVTVRGTSWAQIATLFTERFRGTPWQGDRSLSLVITHTPPGVDIKEIKKDIKKFTPAGADDLSDYACTYDPLNPDDRQKQLNIIDTVRTYQRRDIKIVMKKDQLWAARVLGDTIEKEVYADLANNKMHVAKKKVKFAHGIAELGNADLSKILKTALDGVHSYSNDLISDMEKRGNSPESRYPYLKKYKEIKENFGAYTKFDRHDSDATNIRNQLSDERDIAWDKPTAFVVGGVATVGAGTATGLGVTAAAGGASALSGLGIAAAASTAVAAAPIIAIAGGIATVGCLCFTAYAGVRWLCRSQKELDTSAYYETSI